MTKLESIRNTIKDLLMALDHKSASEWKTHFTGVLNSSYSLDSNEALREWVRQITGVYGGMGSFNDLLIQENDKILKRETLRMKELRAKLLDEALQLLQPEPEPR